MHAQYGFKALSLIAAAALITACGGDREQTTEMETAITTERPADAASLFADLPPADAGTEAGNLLLSPFSGPYGGVPHFARMDVVGLKPAIEAAMARGLAEIEAIAGNPEPPTFTNTIVAYDQSQKDYLRVGEYYGIWNSNLSSPEFRRVKGELAPMLANYESTIRGNAALFERIQSVYESDEYQNLGPAEQRLTWLIYDDFASNGATLEGEDKERYAEIQARLAELHTTFADNVLADEEGYVTYLGEEDLAGLSDSYLSAAAAAAAERGRPTEYAVTNTRSSVDPLLTYADVRRVRKAVWEGFYGRGDYAGDHDNNPVIAEIVKLRDERVGLLGYDNYAEWRLQNRMAGTPERALELMETVWPAAVQRVEEEVADMQAIADEEGADITIEPWDYRYYMEKLRARRHDIDMDEVKQYLQLHNLREAMFMVAGEIFGFEFSPITDGSVPVWQEDVGVWEVTDADSGEHIGLWYLDPFARQGKRSGAWATSFRLHTTVGGKTTALVSNNSNFVEGKAGEPVLVSWSDAETFFHEFGHALHMLSSNVDYQILNGGVRDYTEFQSQLLERWLMTERVIKGYLKHVDTGEPMPDELVQKIRDAATFKQGFDTGEYLASALVDMRYHTTDPEDLDPREFEKATLEDLGTPSEIVMRHRSPHFSHVFSSEGYAAAYYGYMWADVLTADAAEAFAEAPGGFYDKALAKELVEKLFAVRNAVDPAEAYRDFRGRDADVGALMRDRGFE